jgi:hypothetical protein
MLIKCEFARLDVHQSMMLCKHPQFGEYAICTGILAALGCPKVLMEIRK